MYTSLMVSALLSAGGMVSGQLTPETPCWKLDKTTVMSGGCVTLVLDDVCSSMRGLKVQIDDYGPLRVSDFVAPKMERHYAPDGLTTTFILIGHDFRSPEGYELVAEEPETYRMVPIFDEPGTVRVTVTNNERSLGSELITVVPLAPEAEEAVRLLFPTVIKDQGPIRNWAKCVGLLVGGDHTLGAQRDGPMLPEFRKELEVLRKHPDWAEIFEMLVVWVETRVAVHEFREALRTAGDNIDENLELPPLPTCISKALESEPQSVYARAVRDDIRYMIAWRKRLLREHGRTPGANR